MNILGIVIVALCLGVCRLLMLSAAYECPKKRAICYLSAWATAIILGIVWLIAYSRYM